jgi:diguanylate cyclase (GGDEF)-like protein
MSLNNTRKQAGYKFKDSLTNHPNRFQFERDLTAIYASKTLSYDHSFVGLINIDNFKLVNHTYSYLFGDQLLIKMIHRLNQIPEIKNFVYRFGGDEFAFIVDNKHGEHIFEIAQKITYVLDLPFEIEGKDLSITVSMGLVYMKEGEKSVMELLRKLNLAVNECKSSGKNKYVLYDSSMKKNYEDTLTLEVALKKAVKLGFDEFDVVFQPIINATNGEICSAEALMRWNSLELGVVPPVRFIPVAETSGMIILLGKYILDRSLRQVKEWLDAKLDISVSVNFSVLQMLQSDLISSVMEALQLYKVPAKYLTIEITESLIINDITRVIEILNALRGIGVRIAIDDFGTGYSSLNHLRRLPLDYVKIDRSFIFNIEYDPYTLAFIDTITKFCHFKNTKVCCEGVETITQRKMLENIDVDFLQGFLFSKPISALEFCNILKR